MQDRDLTSVGLVLTGSSVTAAGSLIGVILTGAWIASAPFLLLTSAVLVVLSAALILFSILKNPTSNRKACLCRTLL